MIPNRRLATVRRSERSNKVIWETVIKVAERAGVTATAHALRRAFAVAFLTSHPGALESLQALMNHSRIDTTQVHLRALNRSLAIEAVRDLTWASGFKANAVEAHTGAPLPRFLAHLQKVEDARKLARIVLEAGGDEEPPKQSAGATSGGDWERLRGLPAIGRGVSGAIRGTDPVRALIAKERRR